MKDNKVDEPRLTSKYLNEGFKTNFVLHLIRLSTNTQKMPFEVFYICIIVIENLNKYIKPVSSIKERDDKHATSSGVAVLDGNNKIEPNVKELGKSDTSAVGMFR